MTAGDDTLGASVRLAINVSVGRKNLAQIRCVPYTTDISYDSVMISSSADGR